MSAITRSQGKIINSSIVKALKQLTHPNIVRLHEVVREHRELHFIFEHLQQNLYQAVRHRRITLLSEVRNVLKQIFLALEYMHRVGFVHRDIKPENILLSLVDAKPPQTGQVWVVKLADLGLARKVPPNDDGPPLTQYVSTRWYRAPEVLLRCRDYEFAVDTWAMGTVATELCTGRPLFPGRSEPDQLSRLCSVLGTPDTIDAPGGLWLKGVAMARSLGLRFPKIIPTSLPKVLPGLDLVLLDLVTRLLRWDPVERPTCSQALQHPFFTSTIDRPLLGSSNGISANISTLIYGNSVASTHKNNNAGVSLVSIADVKAEEVKKIDPFIAQTHQRAHKSLPSFPNEDFQEDYEEDLPSSIQMSPKSPAKTITKSIAESLQASEVGKRQSMPPSQKSVKLAEEPSTSSVITQKRSVSLLLSAEKIPHIETAIATEDEDRLADSIPELELSCGESSVTESVTEKKNTKEKHKKKAAETTNTEKHKSVKAALDSLINRGKRSKTIDARQREPERAASRMDISRIFRNSRSKTPKRQNESISEQIATSRKVSNEASKPPTVKKPVSNIESSSTQTDADRGRKAAGFSLPRLFNRNSSVSIERSSPAGPSSIITRERGRSRVPKKGIESEASTSSPKAANTTIKGQTSTKDTVRSSKNIELPRLVGSPKVTSKTTSASAKGKGVATSTAKNSFSGAKGASVKKTGPTQKAKEAESSKDAARDSPKPTVKESPKPAVKESPKGSVKEKLKDTEPRRRSVVDLPKLFQRGRSKANEETPRSSLEESSTTKSAKKRARSTGEELNRTLSDFARRLRTPKEKNENPQTIEEEEVSDTLKTDPNSEKRKSHPILTSTWKWGWRSSNSVARTSIDLSEIEDVQKRPSIPSWKDAESTDEQKTAISSGKNAASGVSSTGSPTVSLEQPPRESISGVTSEDDKYRFGSDAQIMKRRTRQEDGGFRRAIERMFSRGSTRGKSIDRAKFAPSGSSGGEELGSGAPQEYLETTGA